MNKEIIKTTGIVILIYIVSYGVTGALAGLPRLLVPIYGLSLVKKRNLIAIKTLLILMIVLNIFITIIGLTNY